MYSLPHIAAVAQIDGTYSKAKSQFEKNEKRPTLYMDYKLDGKTATVKITGETTTKDGIAVNKWKKETKYSIGLRLSEEDQKAIIDLSSSFIAQTGLPPNFRVTTPLKEDLIYLNLKPKTDKKSFDNVTTSDNIKLDPKKPDQSGLSRGDAITVTIELGAYINMESDDNGNDNAGIYFKLRHIEKA
jgi:hypothetical protein